MPRKSEWGGGVVGVLGGGMNNYLHKKITKLKSRAVRLTLRHISAVSFSPPCCLCLYLYQKLEIVGIMLRADDGE